LNIPVFATTQNKARLGETCPELGLDAPDGVKTKCHLDKTLFSMMYTPRHPPSRLSLMLHRTPEVKKALDNLKVTGPLSCIIVGIESHICVTQTTIEGAVVTTSESFMYECVGDAGTPEYVDAASHLVVGVTAKIHAHS
jgi:hypothetical protein